LPGYNTGGVKGWRSWIASQMGAGTVGTAGAAGGGKAPSMFL